MLNRKPGDKCVYKNMQVVIKSTNKDHSNGYEYYELEGIQGAVTESELTDLFVEKKQEIAEPKKQHKPGKK